MFYLWYALIYLLSHKLLGRDVILFLEKSQISSVGVILDKKNQLLMCSFILLTDTEFLLSFPPHNSYRGVSLVEENTEHIIFVCIPFF